MSFLLVLVVLIIIVTLPRKYEPKPIARIHPLNHMRVESNTFKMFFNGQTFVEAA
jgi:hypothetical protein